MAKRNAYLRRVAIAPHDGFFSAHGMVLRPRGKHILPEFLPFFLTVRHVHGTGHRNIGGLALADDQLEDAASAGIPAAAP